jgi:glucokinase
MYLAIEFGGTKLQMALGEGNGKLAALWREKIDPAKGAEGIRRQIEAGLPGFLAQNGITSASNNLLGAGIGFGGPVDTNSGETITSHQIQGWDRYPIVEWLRGLLKAQGFGSAPVHLGNDADVAGLGEAVHGAGQGANPVFYVTVGSGIGGGLILDGRIHPGVGLGAAEIGHLTLGPGGDILEHHASGWGIQKRYRKGSGGENATVPQIAELAKSGDTVAAEVLSGAIRDLAWGLCQVIALICPKRIVIGGGVSLLGEATFFKPLRAEVSKQVFRPYVGLTEIVSATLGEEVVLHGALALATQPDK